MAGLTVQHPQDGVALVTLNRPERLNALDDEMLNDLPAGYHDAFVERIQAVTLEQANAAVRNRISLEHLVVVVLGTHAAIGGEVKKAIPSLASERIVPFDTE